MNGTPERAALVGLVRGRRPGIERRTEGEQSLEELAQLVAAAGGRAVFRMCQERRAPDPATWLGRGKLEQLGAACDEAEVDVVVFDGDLSPGQLREVEEAIGRRVIDRTQLILDIFARRARTREGRMQVELAQLEYLLPRLVGAGAALSRLGGGIGTRGPGETKLETDRRRVRQRIHALHREIDRVRRHRRNLRGRRQRSDVPTVALVGYTNAGKTTLFNALTGQQAQASDALFVTLDPLVRQVQLPDARTLLLSDTVGFIDRLPHSLVAAFRATLEEVSDADLIVQVVDAADPDRDRHMAAVERVLTEIGAAGVPRVLVFNKSDVITEHERRRLASSGQPNREAQCVSARTGEDLGTLLELMVARVALDTRRVRFELGREEDRGRIASIYRHARVLTHVTVGDRVSIEAEVPRRLLARLSSAGSERTA